MRFPNAEMSESMHDNVLPLVTVRGTVVVWARDYREPVRADTMTRFVFDARIAPVAKYRCFVCQVFQSGRASEHAAVGPKRYRRSPMRSAKHLKHKTQYPPRQTG